MASRVFIVQDNGRRNYGPAMQYGELVPMIGRDAFPDNASLRAQEMSRIIRSKLQDYNPARDYVLLAGDPVAIMLTGMILSKYEGCDAYVALKWDREAEGYFPVVMQP